MPNGVPAEALERQVGTPPHGHPAIVCPGNCPAMCSGDGGQRSLAWAPEKPPLSGGSSAKPLEDVTSLVTSPEHHRGSSVNRGLLPWRKSCPGPGVPGDGRGSPQRCPCLALVVRSGHLPPHRCWLRVNVAPGQKMLGLQEHSKKSYGVFGCYGRCLTIQELWCLRVFLLFAFFKIHYLARSHFTIKGLGVNRDCTSVTCLSAK